MIGGFEGCMMFFWCVFLVCWIWNVLMGFDWGIGLERVCFVGCVVVDGDDDIYFWCVGISKDILVFGGKGGSVVVFVF